MQLLLLAVIQRRSGLIQCLTEFVWVDPSVFLTTHTVFCVLLEDAGCSLSLINDGFYLPSLSCHSKECCLCNRHAFLYVLHKHLKNRRFFAAGQGRSLHIAPRAMWIVTCCSHSLHLGLSSCLRGAKEGRLQSKSRDGRGTLKGCSKESKMELQKGHGFRSREHQEEYPK